MIPAGAAGATRLAAWLLAAVLLAGCATRPPLLGPRAASVELAQTPFFPQRKYQCGPASLATVLVASGVQVTPEQLEPMVYLPGRRGSLQLEMQAAPRAWGRLAYVLDPDLRSILGELDSGRPVLALHNYGLPVWPRWHYVVAYGYDATADQLLLRSGRIERDTWSARNFMRAWDNGGRWAMVMLRPGELPANPHRLRYLEAAAGFEKSAAPADVRDAFDAAIRAWPDEPVAYVGRGTAHYRLGEFHRAAEDYEAALRLNGSLHGARNNLAMTLLELGCVQAAQRELDHIDPAQLSPGMREAVDDTRRQLRARGAARCNRTT